MVSGNHPSFPRQIGAFQANLAACALPRTGACRARLDCQNGRSAQKTHEIKPNKAEAKNRRNCPTRHREEGESRVVRAVLDKAEKVTLKQLQKGVVMVQALCIVGAVILAALVVGALVAWLVGRARQEIDSWKIDAERL